MPEQPKKNKGPSKKHQPRGLSIVYEDRDIIVVNKRSGLLTMSTGSARDKTAYSSLTHYVRKGNYKSRNRIFIVHRLDKDTSGVLVFAKNESAKRFLQDEWQQFTKTYYAVVHGIMPEKEGVITSYLAENRAHKMYSVRDPGKGKYASTGYVVRGDSRHYSLLEITLHTGKKNQIRVHLSEQGCPIVGDAKYGEKKRGGGRLALHAARLSIVHPYTKEQMTFEAAVPQFFNTLIKSPHIHKGPGSHEK